MVTKSNSKEARKRRHARVRAQINGSTERPRLCVFRSLNHIYAQIIDDSSGNTVASASSLDKDIAAKANGKKKKELADLVGTLIAKRSIEKGFKTVVFDRGGYRYHGRVQSLADAARKAGLQF